MSVDLARELIEAGLAADPAEIEELHRTDGPAVITACCRARARLIWIEHEHRLAGRVAEHRHVVAALNTVLQQAGLRDLVVLPTIGERATAIYPGLPASSLLVDALLPGRPLAIGPQQLRAVCRELARYLARLHATPRATLPHALLRDSPALHTVMELVARRRGAAPATLGLEAVQELLTCERHQLAEALASACGRFDQCADSVLLHGRFCPGFVVATAKGDVADLRIIGWTAAAFGPAEFDLGWCVGELEELAKARQPADAVGAQLLRGAGGELVRAYLRECPAADPLRVARECGAYAAVKVVAHLAEYARYFALDRSEADAQLALAERLIEPAWAARLLAGEAQ